MLDGTIIGGPVSPHSPMGRLCNLFSEKGREKSFRSHGGRIRVGLSSCLCPSTRQASKPLSEVLAGPSSGK